jgi:hypothetical protein
MDNTWAPNWITTDVTKFISQKRKARELLTLLSFPFKNGNATYIFKGYGQHCSLGTVQCPSKTIPCGAFQSHWNSETPSTAPTIRDFLSGPSIRNCTPCTPVAQTSSQLRSTVPPVHSPEVAPLKQKPPVPATPSQYTPLARYPSPRVSPSQAPSPRVAPIMNPVDVSSLRVDHTLSLTSVIPLNPHPEAENTPLCASRHGRYEYI